MSSEPASASRDERVAAPPVERRGQREPQPGPSPGPVPAPGSNLPPGLVASLQRSAGNGAVQHLLQRATPPAATPAGGSGRRGPAAGRATPVRPGAPVVSASRDRVGQAPAVVQRTPNARTVAALRSQLPTTQADARVLGAHANLGEAYVNLSVATTDLISTKLQLFALNYDSAYQRYARVVGSGRAEAQNQTLWRGIFLGIGTGVLAGLAAAYIAPSTAAGWLTLTLADAGTAAASSLLQSGASAAVAYALSDAMTARGSDLQPTGLTPDMLRSNIWRHVAGMYRGAFATTRVLANLYRNQVLSERIIAEMRVHIAGGDSDYTAEDVLRASEAMATRVARMQSVFDGLSSAATALRSLSSSATSYDPNRPSVDQMEDDIWVMWIGSLSDDDSDILDLDAIEDHLLARRIIGPGSRLGVDFEGYTSEEDELAAIAAGRRRAADVRQEYDRAASGWSEPPR